MTGEGTGAPPRLCAFEVFCLFRYPSLKIKAGKDFIIRQISVRPFLLTLINATKLGRLLTLSKVQLSHQLSVLGAGISTHCEHHALSTGSGSQKMFNK